MTSHSQSKGKVIVSSILFWYPLAGVTYQVLHYMEGLRRLGFDPYYIEDSGRWIYDPALDDLSPDPTPNLKAIVVTGHSAGGQYVTRYEMSNRVHETVGTAITYVVANPSSYAWPSATRPSWWPRDCASSSRSRGAGRRPRPSSRPRRRPGPRAGSRARSGSRSAPTTSRPLGRTPGC